MRFQLYTPCSVGTCDTPKPTDSGYPGGVALGWRIYQNWGWVCPRHVHICDWGCGFDPDHEEMRGEDCVYDPIAAAGARCHRCGPQCYDIVDAGCCEDHPDCVYDAIPAPAVPLVALARAARGHRDLIAGTASWKDIGGPALERVVEGLTDSSDGTFEGETTLTVN